MWVFIAYLPPDGISVPRARTRKVRPLSSHFSFNPPKQTSSRPLSLVLCPTPNKRHLDRRRNTLPPQWRDPCISSLLLFVLSHPNAGIVISTGANGVPNERTCSLGLSSRFCELRSGETRFSTHTASEPKPPFLPTPCFSYQTPKPPNYHKINNMNRAY